MTQTLSLGPLQINLYSALIGLGVLLPVVWQLLHSGDERVLADVMIIGLLALVAGRIGYVAVHWTYFENHREQIVSLASSGYSEHLALLLAWGLESGMLRVFRPTAYVLRLSPYTFLAIITCVGIGASIGCISSGCAFGREVFWQNGIYRLGWLIRADWPDAFGVHNPRWPTQAIMAMWLAFCYGSALFWQRRGQLALGQTLAVWVLLFSMGDSVIQLLRADESLLIRNIRIEQYFNLILFILSIYTLFHRYRPTSQHT